MENTSAGQDNEMMLFFTSALEKMYWAENNIDRLLDQMRAEAYSQMLKNNIEMNQMQTHRHIERLEQVFNEMDQKPEEKFCEALKGLFNDAMVIFTDTRRKTRPRDIGIAGSLLKIQHYKMATYAILIQISEAAGLSKATELLRQNVSEVKVTEVNLNGRPS